MIIFEEFLLIILNKVFVTDLINKIGPRILISTILLFAFLFKLEEKQIEIRGIYLCVWSQFNIDFAKERLVPMLFLMN